MRPFSSSSGLVSPQTTARSCHVLSVAWYNPMPPHAFGHVHDRSQLEAAFASGAIAPSLCSQVQEPRPRGRKPITTLEAPLLHTRFLLFSSKYASKVLIRGNAKAVDTDERLQQTEVEVSPFFLLNRPRRLIRADGIAAARVTIDRPRGVFWLQIFR